MKLENTFDVAAPPPEAWAVLVDVAKVVPCVPGASLTEIIDENSYKGSVKVKLGPVSLVFDGAARFVERDDANFRAKIKADGREGKGRGSAQADVDFSLVASPGGATVIINTDLNLSGPVAQYGRSQGVITAVAEEMVAQFAGCLQQKILSGDSARTADEEDGTEAPSVSGFSLLAGALKRWVTRLFGRGR
ncbi:MAG: SRPBCC family protein [Proteobacteria bacterium]|nr:SRPBCC family protein [Pseudomonadota bacterium]